MKNSELQTLLASYPADMEIKYLINGIEDVFDYTGETLLISSETAYVDDQADEDDWDTEDGKIELGEGEKFLLLNAIIV